MEINELTHRIIGAAIEVHKTLGPGLLEKAYQKALSFELRLRGLKVDEEVNIPVKYKGIDVDDAFRADIIVEDRIIVELKATEKDNPLYSKQLLTYMRFADKELGLLINFNKARLLDGVERVINT
ncbi:MAG: GxxExxY protein [Muribaculaceae bacterium]|nr:GxxExxY protein [Muribaculaceae bacterium]